MKVLFKNILVASTILFFSCGSNDNDPTDNCETLNSPIVQLFSSLVSNTTDYIDEPEWMDLETHEYNVTINVSGEICSIGYQNPSTYTGDYLMEIIGPNGTYAGVHTFSQTATEYISIPPIQVNAGDTFTIRRTIQTYTNLNETVGRMIRRTNSANIAFPINLGNTTINSSNFYGAGGPVPNIGIPYIAFGFSTN